MLFEKLISLWTQGSRVQPLLIAELTSELSSKPHRATFMFCFKIFHCLAHSALIAELALELSSKPHSATLSHA